MIGPASYCLSTYLMAFIPTNLQTPDIICREVACGMGIYTAFVFSLMNPLAGFDTPRSEIMEARHATQFVDITRCNGGDEDWDICSGHLQGLAAVCMMQ